jgi:hypothetical protein
VRFQVRLSIHQFQTLFAPVSALAGAILGLPPESVLYVLNAFANFRLHVYVDMGLEDLSSGNPPAREEIA